VFWVNPYSQRSQRHRYIWPLDEAKAQEAAKRQALQRELLEIRRGLDEVKHALATRRAAQQREFERLRRKSDLAWDHFIRTFERYAAQQKAGFNRDQPRDDHGKWTDAGGDKERPEDAPKPGLTSQPSTMRRGGPRMPATPAQQARLAVANARAREAVGRVQQLDPHWRPQSATSRDNSNDFEVIIRAKEAETREAEARFMALSRVGYDDSYARRGALTSDELFVPGGERIGSRMPNSAENVRTVTPATFEELRTELMGGARRIDPDPEYNGVWYRRQDGSEFGLRISRDHGLTIDVLRSDHPLLRDGFRIHQR
jgi:hypothetical protein